MPNEHEIDALAISHTSRYDCLMQKDKANIETSRCLLTTYTNPSLLEAIGPKEVKDKGEFWSKEN